jgi:hypothetical protein
MAAVLLMATAANATVISGLVTGGTAFGAGGTFIKLTVPLGNPFGPPNSVGDDTFQSPNLYAFDEDQNVTVVADLDTDDGVSPILAGTIVASHYVFFDPGPTQSIIGAVNFDSKVLAVISSTGKLLASDYLANTGVNYLNPAARGLEAGDSVTINLLDDHQILFDTTASTPGDYVRVLTEYSPGAVPARGILTLLAGGLAVVAPPCRRAWHHTEPRRRGGLELLRQPAPVHPHRPSGAANSGLLRQAVYARPLCYRVDMKIVVASPAA